MISSVDEQRKFLLNQMSIPNWKKKPLSKLEIQRTAQPDKEHLKPTYLVKD